jgi:hypothetical protein
MSIPRPILLCLVCLLAACDQIAALDGTKAREADGFAVGSACRQAGRAIEDCFNMNTDSPKASIFAGWKDMNDYMLQNKLEPVAPKVAKADPAAPAKDDAAADTKTASKDGAKDDAKDGAKDSTKEAVKESVNPATAPQAAAAPAPPPAQGATLVMPGTPATPATPQPAVAAGPVVAPGLPTIVMPVPPRH